MKKEYIKPEMWVEEILLEGMLAISGPHIGNPDNPFDGEGDAPGRQDRRGTWGNLWSEE